MHQMLVAMDFCLTRSNSLLMEFSFLWSVTAWTLTETYSVMRHSCAGSLLSKSIYLFIYAPKCECVYVNVFIDVFQWSNALQMETREIVGGSARVTQKWRMWGDEELLGDSRCGGQRWYKVTGTEVFHFCLKIPVCMWIPWQSQVDIAIAIINIIIVIITTIIWFLKSFNVKFRLIN